MNSRLPAIIVGIVVVAILAFLGGMILAIIVIMPVVGTPQETDSGPDAPTVGPHIVQTAIQPSPTPTFVALVSTPEPSEPTPTSTTIIATSTMPGPGATPTLSPSATATSTQRPTAAPSPTSTTRFAYHYVEGSMIQEPNCLTQYLKGFVKDAAGSPIDGVVVRYQNWNNADFATTGDPLKVWQPGEWKFDYMPQNPGVPTEFVLQILTSLDDPAPLSEPLVIQYTGCHETGQITNIIFSR